MKVKYAELKGLIIIEHDVFEDYRGWFTETYSIEKYYKLGIKNKFVQDNHSYSAKKGTLRGIHFQNNPMAQSKLIRCTRGGIIDFAVDLRKGSDTYKKYFSIELTAENNKQLFIPKGFGHAFLTITDDVEVQYKVDEYFSKEYDRSIRFDDPDLGIRWGIDNPIISKKDYNAPLLKQSDANFSIKVLVTGASGQLGSEIVERLRELDIEVIGVDVKDFDITDKSSTEKQVLKLAPDVIIHCAAYTAVDKAEDEQEKCFDINVEGTRSVALACKKIDAKMVYISTDYIFSGEGSEPQLEAESANPINYYGFTKNKGEDIVKELLEKYFIVRTSWLYGKNGNNFVRSMLNLAVTKSQINVVDDQFGAPTYTKDLAMLLCEMIQTSNYGTYHGVNEGYCSWYEFAVAIFKEAGISIIVNPISSSEYLARAKRPLNSRLSKEQLDRNGFNRLPYWADALKRFFIEYK